MLTKQERIEAARRIRDWCPQSFAYPIEIVRAALGLKQGDLMDDSTRANLAERVAKLIEPEPERTCRLVEKTWDDGFEKDMWGVECDACGRRYPYEDREGIYFCQNCGAEVMEE